MDFHMLTGKYLIHSVFSSEDQVTKDLLPFIADKTGNFQNLINTDA
ncbi:Uncharacterised protein [Chlamydia trachomatis]|nr:Uncharacterised protein [Chlamydia trachomatis]